MNWFSRFLRWCDFWLAHFRARIFRGSILEETKHLGGKIRSYQSGYVEFVRHSGRTIDCAMAERRGVIPWRCCGYHGQGQGGAGEFVTPPMSRKRALNFVASLGHQVTFVDAQSGIIFYKDKGT